MAQSSTSRVNSLSCRKWRVTTVNLPKESLPEHLPFSTYTPLSPPITGSSTKYGFDEADSGQNCLLYIPPSDNRVQYKINAPYIHSDQFLLAFIVLPVTLPLCAEAIRYGMASQFTIQSVHNHILNLFTPFIFLCSISLISSTNSTFFAVFICIIVSCCNCACAITL